MSIEQAYNSWAEQYDTNNNKTRDLDIISTIETLEKYNFNNVLELGCGTAKNTEWLLTKSDKIIGFDFSEKMLNIAQKKITDNKATFKKVDLNQDWEIENKSVDLITSSLTLEHIENLDHIFNQANQKLIEQGLFFISELHPYKQYAGSGARYESPEGTITLKVYTHHISDFISTAKNNKFELLEMNEWFDDIKENKPPRLISFVFRKIS